MSTTTPATNEGRAARGRLVVLVAVLGALALAAALLPVRMLAIRALALAESLGPAGGAAYVVVYVLACVLMIPGTLLTLGAGFLYGTLGGLLVVVPGSTLGATAAFLVARGAGRRWTERRIAGHPAFLAIDRAVARRGFRTVLLLRLVPVLPFNALNYALGLTSVRLRDYVLASALGMLPATLLVVHAGSVVTSLSGLGEAAPRGPASLALIAAGLVAVVLVVVMIGRAARRSLQDHLDAGESP